MGELQRLRHARSGPNLGPIAQKLVHTKAINYFIDPATHPNSPTAPSRNLFSFGSTEDLRRPSEEVGLRIRTGFLVLQSGNVTATQKPKATA